MNVIYDSIHNFIINPTNKRFMINSINKTYRFKNIVVPLDILKKFKIVLMCENTKAINHPLSLHVDKAIFKLYYSDVGLLTSVLGLDENSLLLYKIQNKNSNLWGAVIENSIFNNLNCNQFYYHRFNINNNVYEIDLLIEDQNDDIIPVEIKSKSGKHKLSSSLQNIFNYIILKNILHWIK